MKTRTDEDRLCAVTAVGYVIHLENMLIFTIGRQMKENDLDEVWESVSSLCR